MRGLDDRIRRLIGETRAAGFGGVPDVIAHSFGTWLLGQTLRANPRLRVGRVILTGCILRPDFDWNVLIKRGQVEAVLCHVATKDFWAGIAHYLIPNSGPSGRRGFNDRLNVGHAVFPDRHHSDFFKTGLMPGLFQHVWQPFLTGASAETIANGPKLPAPNWQEAWWPFRAKVFRICLLVIAGALTIILVAALFLGMAALWNLV